MRKRTRKGAGMDRLLALRFNGPVYDHLQQIATDLGLTITEYCRLMSCWHAPYLLLVTDARKILQGGGDDAEDTLPRLRLAVQRLQDGQEEIDRLMGSISAGLVESQARSREQVQEFRAMLEERLAQFEAAAAAFQTIRKRLG